MIRTFARRAAVATMPLIALPVITLAAAPGPAFATAPSATIHFTDQARLQPNGSVVVTVTYSCFPDFNGPTGEISVNMQQDGVGGFANDLAAVCDSTKHTDSLDVIPFPGVFSRGSANATVQVNNFGFTSIATAQALLKVR